MVSLMARWFCCTFFAFVVFAQSASLYASSPLPEDQAFQVSLKTISKTEVSVQLKAAPGYYLYANKTFIALVPSVPADIRYPQGVLKKNNVVGQYTAYMGTTSIPVTFHESKVPLQFEVRYQGCSLDGFCYPPMIKTINLASTSSSGISLMALVTDQHEVASFFLKENVAFIFLVFMVLGLLLAFTPCVLPMIPILTGIILGQHHKVGTKEAFFLSLSYVAGVALTYSFAGLLAASIGNSLQLMLQQPWAILMMSFVFLLLALSLFGFYGFHMPRVWQNKIFDWSDRHERGTYVGVFLMGVLSTLIVSPCVTAPLIGILLYISQTGNQWLGAGALFAMGVGMGIPLVLIGISAGHWLPRSGKWMKSIKMMFGVLMLLMAVWMVSRVLPSHVQNTFIVIHDVNQFHQALVVAEKENKPVLLDFYADWCSSCVEMDRKVFNNREVKEELKSYLLLRVDLSHNTSEDRALMKYFKVIAPPSILFFNGKGEENNLQRIVGEMNPRLFLGRLEQVTTSFCQQDYKC